VHSTNILYIHIHRQTNFNPFQKRKSGGGVEFTIAERESKIERDTMVGK
jgi:hypothetical protein